MKYISTFWKTLYALAIFLASLGLLRCLLAGWLPCLLLFSGCRMNLRILLAHCSDPMTEWLGDALDSKCHNSQTQGVTLRKNPRFFLLGFSTFCLRGSILSPPFYACSLINQPKSGCSFPRLLSMGTFHCPPTVLYHTPLFYFPHSIYHWLMLCSLSFCFLVPIYFPHQHASSLGTIIHHVLCCLPITWNIPWNTFSVE